METLEYESSLSGTLDKIKIYKVYASKTEMTNHTHYSKLDWKPADEVGKNLVCLEFLSRKKAYVFFRIFSHDRLCVMTNFIVSDISSK